MPVLAVVRSIDGPRRLATAAECEDFEQELLDQYALAAAGSGITDRQVAKERYILFEFLRFLGRPLWTCQPADADRYLAHMRRDRSLAPSTVTNKAWVLSQFYDFLISRYQGDIHTLTGYVLTQPIDEFNRGSKPYSFTVRVPPADADVDKLFDAWRVALPGARKYLPAARDYLAASLWRRVGLRITETAMLDMRDWRPDIGAMGKLHVRFGKGSLGRGPKSRMVPAINSVADLIQWWLVDIRHQFGDDWDNPEAPLLPSERRDPMTGRCERIGASALRAGFAVAVGQWLPSWQGKLTPHTLRHYCASSLYARGMDLKAIQELLGHSWLQTTTLYVHVQEQHIEHAWAAANDRVAARLGGGKG